MVVDVSSRLLIGHRVVELRWFPHYNLNRDFHTRVIPTANHHKNWSTPHLTASEAYILWCFLLFAVYPERRANKLSGGACGKKKKRKKRKVRVLPTNTVCFRMHVWYRTLKSSMLLIIESYLLFNGCVCGWRSYIFFNFSIFSTRGVTCTLQSKPVDLITLLLALMPRNSNLQALVDHNSLPLLLGVNPTERKEVPLLKMQPQICPIVLCISYSWLLWRWVTWLLSDLSASLGLPGAIL